MHDTALELGRQFFARYLPPPAAAPARILDVGSMDVNGSLRQALPEGRVVAYTGVDLEAGPGVDVIVSSAARLPFDGNWFDVVVSTSVFEHDSAFWQSFEELVRVTAPGGFIYVNAPSNGHVHQHPRDCWRFYPDAGIALCDWTNRGLVEHQVVLVESFVYERRGSEWNDLVMVFCKAPVPKELPKPPLCQDENAKNIRLRGHTGLGRFEPLTEDQRLGMALGTMSNHVLGTLRSETVLQLAEGMSLLGLVIRFDQSTTSDEVIERELRRWSAVPDVEKAFVHEGPLLRPLSFDGMVHSTDGIFEQPRTEGFELLDSVYVLEPGLLHEYPEGALGELTASLRAEPVGMLVCELDGEATETLDPRQVVLRRGVALAFAHEGPNYQPITDALGFCRSPIRLGAR